MRTILFIRHAEAEVHTKRQNRSDFERQLTEQGKKNARKIAKLYRERQVPVDCIVSSTAFRAMETAQVTARVLEFPLEGIVYENSLYSAEVPTYLDVIHRLPDTCQTVAIVGHNPALTDVVRFFAPEFSESLGKGELAAVTFSKKHWSGLDKSDGKLAFVLSRGDKLDDPFSALRNDVESSLLRKISETLITFDANKAELMGSSVHRAAERLAQRFVKITAALAKEEKSEAT